MHRHSNRIIEGLVSTIIPVYNRAMLLQEAVASVLAQTYRPIEIIVVDDGSSDDTGTVADKLASEYPGEISVIHQHNTGPGLAREAGRQIAKGEFIQYLDSDDILLPNKFELQVAGLKTNPECGISYGWTRYRHSDGHAEKSPWKGSGRKVETMFPSMLLSRWWDTPNPLYKRILCDKAGPWIGLRLEEDWEYDCRIAALGVKLHYADEYIVEVRDHDNSRLCKGAAIDPLRLKERTRSHALILKHAQKTGLSANDPEMQHFARALFLLSRQCGAAGLEKESEELFGLSREAAGQKKAKGWDYRIYGFFAAIIGWPFTGKISCKIDRCRR